MHSVQAHPIRLAIFLAFLCLAVCAAARGEYQAAPTFNTFPPKGKASELTNAMSHLIVKGSLFGYNEKCSVGSLTFDTKTDDSTVTYRVINIDGDVIPIRQQS